uniref:Uncharacterized protein n=1 Tax=Magallana gigas TaxID=29159 RepID=A0A8W8P265_MAGGI|nr:uncharacterized protein LOC105346817 [Crassostrea gigas]
MVNFGLQSAILTLLFTVAATYDDVIKDSLILKQDDGQPRSQERNPKHLEPPNDDDDGSSLQFCVCPRKPNGCVCEKEWSIRLSKEEIAKFPDHGLFQRTNELNGNVERGVNNKRSPYDHTTLPPEIERLDPGHVLRIIYVNLETEELRRQFLERHRKFLQ